MATDVEVFGPRLRGRTFRSDEELKAFLQVPMRNERARALLRWLRSQPTVAQEVDADRALRKVQLQSESWKRKYEYLLNEYDKLHDQHEAALALTGESLEPLRVTPIAETGTSEAVAIVVASDWHVEERVESKSVNGLNAYNLEVAERRAARFFDKALRIVRKERQDVRIETMLLCLLGDFITGRIHEENLETCDLRPMEAILFAQGLLEGGIRFLLENSNLNLLIPCRPGNHSRITRQVHAATEDGNSLETLMYASLAKTFAHEKRVRFELQPAYHCLVDVYGYTVRLHHGHAIQYGGGVGGLHIPIRKALAQWDSVRRSTVDCIGHWHTYAATTRRYVVNGSLIGMNAFGVRIKADYEPPMQAFLLLDKKRGVTVQLPLLVDD